MNNEHELNEIESLETHIIIEKEDELSENQAKDAPKSTTQQDCVVQIIYDQGEQVSSSNDTEKPNVPVILPNKAVIYAQLTEAGSKYYSPDNKDNPRNAYYQEQYGGQYGYGQGTPPADAASTRRGVLRMGRGGGSSGISGNDVSAADSSIFGGSFDDVAIRNRFVRKVYTILTVQLLCTCAFIVLCMYEPHVNKFVKNDIYFFIAIGIELLLVIVLACCDDLRRNFPINFIILAAFTIVFAYTMGAITTMYSTTIVVTAAGITAAITLIISLFACQTSYDVTSWGSYLCIIVGIVTLFGVIAIIIFYVTGMEILFIIYAGISAIVFTVYLMYDTQMIMGGRRYEISPEEYIYAALSLYLDIMNLFLDILIVLGFLSR